MSLHITSCDVSPLLHLRALCGICKMKPDWFDKEFVSQYKHKYAIRKEYLGIFEASFDRIKKFLQDSIDRNWITHGYCEI